MAPVLLPSRLIGSAAERAGGGAEASGGRRRRLRWVAAAVAALGLVGAGLGAWAALGGGSRGAAAGPSTLELHFEGFATPLGRPPCPGGRRLVRVGAGARPVGSVTECVLTVVKDGRRGSIRSVSSASLDTYALPGGTVVVRQARTTLFALDQRHTSTFIEGRVLRGTGGYARSRGTLTGGGPGLDGKADWSVELRLGP